MEDAATAEISRSQIWQWIHNGVRLDDGTPVTAELVRADRGRGARDDPCGDRRRGLDGSRFDDARELFERVALADDFADFLTLPAYELDRLMRLADADDYADARRAGSPRPTRALRRRATRASGRAAAGAHRLRARPTGSRRTWSGAGARDALAALDEHGRCPFAGELARAGRGQAAPREPIEDLRVDFEDGYGVRDDAEEDAAVAAAAAALD